MPKVPFIEQMEHSECGLACTAMVLGYFKYNITLSELRDEIGVPKGGFSLFQLTEIAERYKLSSKAYRVNADDIAKLKIEKPIIIFWENKHFVVLEKIKSKSFYILDPKSGRRKLTYGEFVSSYSNIALQLTPKEGFVKKKSPNYFIFLLKYFFNSPKLISLIFMLSIFLQGMGLGIPLVTKWITDEVLLLKQVESMRSIGYILISILIGYSVLTFTRGYTVAKLQSSLDNSIMSNFVKHLFKLPYAFFENRTSGELLYQTNSHSYLRQVLSNRIISLLIDGILLISYAILMISMAETLGIIIVSIGISLFLLLILSTQVTHLVTSKDVTNQAKVQQYLTESIHGIAEMKVMGLEKMFYKEWSKKFSEQIKSSELRNVWIAILSTIPSTVLFAIPIMVLFIGGFSVMDDTLSIGTIVAFTTLAVSFINPISSIGLAYSELISLKTYTQRIHDVLNSQTEKHSNGKSNMTLTGSIKLNNVSFKYNQYSNNVLENITLEVKPGQSIAIVGSSGSGKSTLAKLLLSLYTPSEGEILFDNINAMELDLMDLKKQLGAVLQETILFNNSIYENITMGNKEVTEEDVIEACRNADILDDILASPLAFNTIVSEAGVNYSGGQRQRLSLARALIKKPSILVLDEATSALDNLSESRIFNSISQLNCTRIIIAHRLSTIINADKIIVLDNGRLVEEGNHFELMQLQGYYFNLYNANKGNEALTV
jgi:ABC-type bacteriocin/lantibiotic exporter with double-glycine peptidase domain